MAKEIYQSYATGSVLYALIFRPSDGYIYDVGHTAFEAIGTWNDARINECDIPLTAIGDMHFVNFPAVAAGTYDVQIRLRAGATPVVLTTVDFLISQGQIIWDGTAEITTASLDTLVDSVLSRQNTVKSAIDETKGLTTVVTLNRL